MDPDRDPDIQLAGLSMWIDGYEHPDATNPDDADWVSVRLVCTGQNATVALQDGCIQLTDLAAWLEVCIELDAGKSTRAELSTLESYVSIVIDHSGEFGRLRATVKITPDHMTQFHEFRYAIDPSYLPRLITSLRIVLGRLPVRGTRPA